MKIHYTVYKVTNKKNGKVYIGTHKTKNLDDGYMGSGKYLKRSIEKHGLDNFTKEILFDFETPEEMYQKEAKLVTEDFIAEENTYNLKVGGFGGFDFVNKTASKYENALREGRKLGRKITDERYKNIYGVTNISQVPDIKEKMRSSLQKAYADGKLDHLNKYRGQPHTEESKRKISNSNKDKRTGKENSQYGTCWIKHDALEKNHRIPKSCIDDWIGEGWLRGRNMKYRKYE